MSTITNQSQATKCSHNGCDRPAYQNPDGSYSTWCGKAHRDAAMAIGANPASRGGLCQNCHVRPAYVENGRVLEFCGRQCATAFQAKKDQNAGADVNQGQIQLNGSSQQTGASQTTDDNSGLPSIAKTVPTCFLDGCTRSVYIPQNGSPSQFCSDSHRREAVRSGQKEACLLCMHNPKAMVNGKESDFCSRRCLDDVILTAPHLFDIPEKYKAFGEVRDQFQQQWKHTGTPPTVHKVWKIWGDKQLNDEYSRYKDAVEKQSNIPGANVRRRFHGTRRACKLGDDEQNRELCADQACFLCGIIRSSFKLVQPGIVKNTGLFGKGIYTSATSSKANEYVKESGRSTFRSMLLNQVVMGNAIKMTTPDPALTQPPTGYDSVVGEPGNSLSYDEAIVYTNDAIRPTYLIIYN